MLEFDEDRRRPGPEGDPGWHAAELAADAAGLHGAIEALNRALQCGSVVEYATARDGFDVALAACTAQGDAT